MAAPPVICDLSDRIIGIPSGPRCDTNPFPITELLEQNPDGTLPLSQQYNDTRHPAVVIDDDRIEDDTGFMPSQYKACKRISSECRKQKAFFLLHAVGSGKTITSLCMAFNMHPSIQTTVITIRGLETAFREEYDNMLKIYDKVDIDNKFNTMRYIFYDEFSSMLLTLSVMSEESRKLVISKIFLNRFIILDEAHKIISILKKDTSGESERMMYYIFSNCAKVIFMTATPLQNDWSDFGRLLKLVGKINDPMKLNSIRVWNERMFKKSFWFPDDLSPYWKIQDNLYTLVFIKFIEWITFTEKKRQIINGYLSIPGIIGDRLQYGLGYLGSSTARILNFIPGLNYLIRIPFATAYTYLKSLIRGTATGTATGTGPAVDWAVQARIASYSNGNIVLGAGVLTATALTAAALLPVIPGIGAVVGAVAAVLGPISKIAISVASFSVMIKTILEATKTGIDIFSPSMDPIDAQQVALLFIPYISFSDYKLTEMNHIKLMNTIRKTMEIVDDTVEADIPDGPEKITLSEYEKILARFPNLHIENINIKMEWEQTSMQYFNTNKGYIPLASDLYLVGRIAADYIEVNGVEQFRYIDSSMVDNGHVPKLQSVLRCVGNFSLDCLEYLPVFDPKTNVFKAKKMSEEVMKQFHGTENYIRDIRPRLEQQNETKRKFIESLNHPGLVLPTVFTCPKFEKTLKIITEARKQFIYLPIVYSNFMDQGLKRFSAFLTGKKLPHIILGPSVLAENPDLINDIQKPFLRWIFGPDNARYYTVDNTEDAIVESIKKIGNYILFNQPCCILLDPSLQEGLSLVFNEVMICLEPMTGYGNKEQVYGRIVRSYSDTNKILNIKHYELYNEETTSEITIGHNDRVTCRGKTIGGAVLKEKMTESTTDYEANKRKIKSKGYKRVKDFTYNKYIELVKSYRSPYFKEISNYKHTIVERTQLQFRPNKFCFQLLSKMYEEPKEEEIVNLKLRSMFNSLMSKLNINPKLSFVKNLSEKIPESYSTPFLYNKILTDPNFINTENKEEMSLWYNFLSHNTRRITDSVNWDRLIPYSMIYSAYIEIDSAIHPVSTNPQKWSEIAKMGIVDTDGKGTSDQYWYSKNNTQELEFNLLRDEFNNITDGDFDRLYPTPEYVISLGRKEHFADDRFTCEDSDIYYPAPATRRHTLKRRCMISSRTTKAHSDTCYRIGPITKPRQQGQQVQQPGGFRKTVRNRKKGGVRENQLQTQLLMEKQNQNQIQEQKQDGLEFLRNYYDKEEQCLSLCEVISTEKFVKEFLKPFVGKSDKEAVVMIEEMMKVGKQINEEITKEINESYKEDGYEIRNTNVEELL